MSDGGTTAQDYLMRGINAYTRKDYASAEPLLLSAIQSYPSYDIGCRSAYVYLGMIRRRSANFDEAITALEYALPLPAAFDELKGIYRFLGKACKKDKDVTGERGHYAKLYSISMLQTMMYEQRLPFDQQEEWMDTLRGKLYWYRPDVEGLDRIERAEVLSATDCKVIRSHLVV